MTPLDRPRTVALVLVAASAALLGGAFWFQHVEGLEPCPLCIAQRWVHAGALAAGLLALAFATGRRAPWLLALAGLVYLGSVAVAGYHVGVEQHWFESAFCGAEGTADSVEALKAQLLATEVARCDEVPWSLAGISMAGYNLIVSAALALVAFAAARRAARKDVA